MVAALATTPKPDPLAPEGVAEGIGFGERGEGGAVGVELAEGGQG